MGKFQDLTGLKFGRLTVIERAETKKGHIRWRCKCECGNFCTVEGWALKSGNTSSCGCLLCETRKAFIFTPTHGHSKEPIYKKWKSIKNRCFNKTEKCYSRYGGRGITISDEFANDFQAFYDYVSQLPHFGEKGYTLDRIDNNGNYERGNLRWATAEQQSRNTRRNVYVEYEGEKITLKDAALRSGIVYGTLWNRYKAGDTGERLFRPVEKHNKK